MPADKVLVDVQGARPVLKSRPHAVRAAVDPKAVDLVGVRSRIGFAYHTIESSYRWPPLGSPLWGVTMNGWFARSLGSSEIAGWLFLAIGVAADLVALAVPSCAAQQWQAGNRTTAAVAWVLWLMPFAFAVTAGIGFASVNISDVTLQRASRVTPAIEAARNELRDAVTSRDRECAGGVGKFCRQREDAVTERRRQLDEAMRSVEQTADPQTEAATRMVSWLSGGMVRPSGDDFAMVRLLLLAFLPQLGGVLLLMICRDATRKGNA
ncbi:hypothetical protein [Bradyrhizobium manausense]|uniref:Uncharacterized protein n=1 Tax=Bradyrhizobium manausense TaxID=989370 RepID=A0A0R3DBP5_9BRAD|nr:hypothetical protein [Bradyrhizobium manausense]KRQ07488.1 hypothetical protein AOQ71_23220 [Bradyrhizobium manausense]